VSPISNDFGRVDSDNNVYVVDNGVERKVGQYSGVPEAEAFAYFERKYAELDANVRILEQRVKNSLDAASIATAANKLIQELAQPAAVGNLQELRNRVAAVNPDIEKLKAEKTEATQKAIAAATKVRQELAEKARALADKDPKKTQWKIASKEMADLFEAWQASQKSGPKMPRKDADALWKIFSQARTKFEANKRAFFAELTAATKSSRIKKTELVTKAEALVSKGASAASEYRRLLDEWKLSGRTSGKQDESLWERFKIAGDAIYALRKETIAKEHEEFESNYEQKIAIIAEAEKLEPAKDLASAKKQLIQLQQRYEKIGKVPKDKVKVTDDRMRAVEKNFKDLEQDNWRKTDPATIERTSGMLSQLEDSIEALERDLALASEIKDTKKAADLADALAARRAWLQVVKQNAG